MSWWSRIVGRAEGPQALKEAPVPINPASSTGRPIFSDWDASKAVSSGLKASTWVYTANRYISSKLSSIPWHVEQLVDEVNDIWEEVPEHPAKLLIDSPNTVMSGQDLRERYFYNLGLAGNAVSAMTIVNKAPVEIWPIFPQLIKPIVKVGGEIEAYEYKPGGGHQPRRIPPQEIIHLMYVDPANLYWGMSPLQAAGMVVDTDVEAVKWNKVSLQNRAKKDYAFFPKEPLTQEQWLEGRRQLRAQHEGAENAGGWFLGAMPGELMELSMTPHEMDFIDSRVQNREEILAAYGLPEILITGKGILRNFEVAEKQFWESLAIPALDDMAEEFNRSIIPWFEPNARREQRMRGQRPRLRYRYDTSHIEALQDNLTEKIVQAQQLVDLGYPLNLVNQRLGLGFDIMPWGDEPTQVSSPAVLFSDKPMNTKSKELEFWEFEWKRLDRQRIEWEKQVEQIIGSLFDQESELIVKAYEVGGQGGIDSALSKNAEVWKRSLEVVYREVVSFFGDQEAERLQRVQAAHKGPGSVKELVFNPFAQFVTSWVVSTAARKVTYIADSTRTVLGNLIGQGVAQNWTTDEIARSIRNTYSEWSVPTDSAVDTRRSYVIARTEVGTAQNWSQMEGARQVRNELGLNIQKRWVSSRDNRVRDSHSMVDGELRPLEEPFSNGLMHPNDPFASAAEVISCRCVASNVIIR